MARSRPMTGLVIAMVGGLLLAAPAQSGEAPPGAGPAGLGSPGSAAGQGARPAESSATAALTLPTGQRVLVQQSERGQMVWTAPQQEQGRPLVQLRSEDGLRVVPADLLPLLPERLDPRLFDLELLQHRPQDETVSVIVDLVDARGTSAAHDPAALAALADRFAAQTGVTVDRQLTSIGSVSAEVTGMQFDRLTAAVATGEAGVSKVWLSGPVRSTLSDSTGQIGAPEAWGQGLTGSGVTVAVLDTGIDAEHPDLAGQVILDMNFSDSPDTIDRFGHGTHVAGIVAGTGAANADYTGVAYGASLLSGKVLDDDGYGWEDDIIAAMEWSADQGADVVNMSLGGWPTDGTDPMSQALNSITEESEVLFVVAAGNEGWLGNYSVGTPGSADLALTVGSVDENDELAFDSSIGPRLGDDAIKPDVTAPGEGIISALSSHAEWWEPIDTFYTEASGTSMAAPHVAGAAAILLQDNPDLTPAQVKSLLMGSAVSTAGSVWEEGAGRITVPGALTQDVHALPASLSFGTFAFPQDDLPPVTDDVTYDNTSDADLTLDLSVEVTDDDGQPVSGAVEVSPAQVTVPAGASTTVQVTLTPGAAGTGLVSGVLLASGDQGSVRTPLGFHNEPELFDLSITMLDWDSSAPADSYATVFNTETGQLPIFMEWAEDGTITARVEAGTYLVVGVVEDEDYIDVGYAAMPDVEVNGPVEVEFDFAESLPVQVQTDRPAEPLSPTVEMAALSDMDDDFGGGGFNIGYQLDPFGQVWVLPSSAPESAIFQFAFNQRWEAPLGPQAMDAVPRQRYRYDIARIEDHLPSDPSIEVGVESMVTVHTVHRTQSAEHWTESVSGRTGSDPELPLTGFGSLYLEEIPHERVEYLSPEVYWSKSFWGYIDWEEFLFDGELYGDAVYQAGETSTENWNGQVQASGSSPWSVMTYEGFLDIWLPGYSDADGHDGWSGDFTDVRMRVWGDGELWDDAPFSGGFYALPEGPVDVRVLLELEREEQWWPLSTATSSEWTFTAEAGDDYEPLPILDIRFQPMHLSADNRVTRVVDLDLVVSHPGAEEETPLQDVVLEWATGGAWQQADLEHVEPGRYRAQLLVPAGVQTVDLRGSAVNADGGTLTTTVEKALGIESAVTRIAGVDRYETAAELARINGYSPHVYLASGLTYSDALSIAGIAGSEHAPVLLTRPDRLVNDTAEAIVDVEATHVTIVGGTDSVGLAVEEELEDLGLTVVRVDGADRYEVAAHLAEGKPTGGTVFVASGQAYADALASGPLAAPDGMPVLLTRGDHLPQVTREALQELQPSQIVVVGGTATIAPHVEAQMAAIADTSRVNGADRYEVAALLAAMHDGGELGNGFESSTAYLASGQGWPDALTLAARAGAQGSPVLLVRSDWVPAVTGGAMAELDSRRATVLGGPDVIQDVVLERVEELLSPAP